MTDTHANQEQVEESQTSQFPACQCGYTRDDVGKVVHVEARGEWGVWGWFSLLVGVTAVPTRLTYNCNRCRIQFDSTTDPEILKKNI